MTVRSRARALWVLFAAAATTALLHGQAPQTPVANPADAKTVPLSALVPTDSRITEGQFANGVKYYVRRNGVPEHRAELRLMVNAGSVLEDDDQRGLAHFVEHMAFNGTKNFPGSAIVDFMQSIGMRFGADVNAYTSFDETVFMLTVPTEDPAILDKAMAILEDWAHNVTFDPAEIDKERGVVMEEWRLGRGAEGRLRDKQFPVLLAGSRYADRLPIGLPEIIQNFKPERLTSFYHDWYRPDLMGVVAVGDFDPAAMQQRISQHFASLPAAKTPRPRPLYTVPDHPGTRYTIDNDKEQPQTEVSVYNIFPARDQTTIGAYRQQIVENLYSGMLSARLSEISQKPDPPFIGADVSRSLFIRSAEAGTLDALVNDNGVDKGLDALFTETARVAKFGFTATELARQKADVLRGYQQAVVEKDKEQSGDLAAEFGRNFTDKEPSPGIEYEYALYQRFLPEITLAEVNGLAKTWSPDRNRVVVVSAPDKPGLKLPTSAELASVMSSAASKNLTAYVDTAELVPLMTTKPTAGSIVSQSVNPAFGIVDWKLSNGARVLLKPTSFKEDQVLVQAFSPGGTSLAPDADFVPAETASQVVAASGLGQFTSIDLRKQLAGKVANVQPFISDTEEGLTGEASSKDLETFFQLINMTFTAPRADPSLFKVMTTQMKALLANQTAQPEFEFNKTLQETLTQNSPRAEPFTPALIDKMDLDKSLAFYKDRFGDASDFTFMFIGNFDIQTMKPFVEQYLASLPSTGRKETWKDSGIRYPTGVIDKTVTKGIDPKSEAAIVYTGGFEFTPANRVAIRAMSMIFENRLREVLREDLGGTYSVQVSPGYSKIPVPVYSVAIEFGCSPDRTAELVKRVYQEIDKFKAAPPKQTELDDVKLQLKREYETRSTDNAYVLSQIVSRVDQGEDIRSFFGLPELYDALDLAAIQKAAQAYFNDANHVQVTLMPEKK